MLRDSGFVSVSFVSKFPFFFHIYFPQNRAILLATGLIFAWCGVSVRGSSDAAILCCRASELTSLSMDLS